MKEFKGDAGTIYIEKSRDSDGKPIEVWFEDFCIIGTGDSDIEALQDAKRHVEDMGRLVGDAIISILTTLPDAHEAGAGG